jgi:hypothetical protein
MNKLAKDFTVINYDRRGRGDSNDTQPYAYLRWWRFHRRCGRPHVRPPRGQRLPRWTHLVFNLTSGTVVD